MYRVDLSYTAVDLSTIRSLYKISILFWHCPACPSHARERTIYTLAALLLKFAPFITMSFLFGGGRPQLSSAEKIAAAETEVEMISDMFNR